MIHTLNTNNRFLQFNIGFGCLLLFFGNLTVFSNNNNNFDNLINKKYEVKVLDTIDPSVEIIDISDVIQRLFKKNSKKKRRGIKTR